MQAVLRVVLPLALVLFFVVGPLFLHFTTKRHNVLPFDVDVAYADGEPFIPGEVYALTARALIEHELDSTTGWRPNDIFLWGPGIWADNKSNRQLGIIQALRESVRVFRDNLTKVSATEYDPNLVDADKFFRNDEFKFWFPSAEGRFREGARSLQRYLDGLGEAPPTSKPLTGRNVELIRLFQAWTDLLGGAHADLYDEEVGFWSTDDHFYHAQGFAQVMYHLTRAIRHEYAQGLKDRQTVVELLDQVERSLSRAAVLKPVVVMDGSPSGFFANHRRNLDSYIVDARQLMYSIREELEK
jgi:hypothetical protein